MHAAFIPHPSSYRDPAGFIFEKDNVLYRQVNLSFKEHFDHFIASGCCLELQEKNLLIPHEQIDENLTQTTEWYTTLLPERLTVISYPYEWSFDMLKDAALLTLQLVKKSLAYGMILKDATPYNIQWHKGRLIFIDSLSFEKYDEAQPWIAYRQFCETFLAPLLLMHYSKISLQQLLLAYPDGIPIGIAKKLLPWRSRLSLYTYLHIHLHADIASRKRPAQNKKNVFTKQKLMNLVGSLELLVQKTVAPAGGIWIGYYEEASQRNDYLDQKKKIILNWVDDLPGIQTAVDFGANEGVFSLLLAERNIQIVSTDFEPFCVNKLFNYTKKAGITNILPLVVDLAWPSPAIGINNKERLAFAERFRTDLSMALALIHHLSIARNIPFSSIAAFLQQVSPYLIIEFVPADDEKVRWMLQQKNTNYDNYTEKNFVEAFQCYFTLLKKQEIPGTGRTVFLMKRKDA